ncbi:MAG: hypothetical protein JSW14_04340 [Candidatus Bathyarchaeum sp.]|nr:MAG: hypothetical protein JSW14_04340 [Candidatus Bathyarchaeum sp.]
MQKAKLSTIELVFVLTAVFTIFIVTVHQMSTDGILPGNDPAVHLGKSEKIIVDERVTYSTFPWYPPLFHTILAILQIFAGTLDVMAAAFILKMLIATLNVLMLLSTYLLSRKLFGTGAAVASALFTILSVPLLEIVFWGGYANFLGLAYIAFIFYIMNKDLRVSVKTFLLFVGAFTIVMAHQLTTFVFFFMFVPAFLVSTGRSKKKLLALLGIIVGGGLALLAWYAGIILQYSSTVIQHLLFTMKENIYSIPEVGLDALIRNNFGASLFLALAGIPMTYILLKKKSLKPLALVILWIAIPFILSQSYLFGIYLPYIRFVYFFATPMTILAGIFTYRIFTYSLTKFPAFIESKITSNIEMKRKIMKATKILSLAIIVTLFLLQSFFFLQRIETYPQFYERASITSYNSGLWISQHSVPEGTIITSRSPGTWFNAFSDHHVIEETDPQYSRNATAEAVLYSFYEMDNTLTLNREYTRASSSAGQEILASVYNIWRKGISIPNKKANVIYVDPFGEWVPTPLSETDEYIYWTQQTNDTAQLISEYTHELFTVEKVVTFSSNSSVINIKWKVKAHQNLASAKLTVTNDLNPAFHFRKALVPGILEWQNPWDNASSINPEAKWALIEAYSHTLAENILAIHDSQYGVFAVFEFHDLPDWLNLGALDDRKIDALRLRYEFGNLAEGETREISSSALLYDSEIQDIEQWAVSDLKQLLDHETNMEIQERDFRTYIEEYNIKFVVVDSQKVLSENDVSPDLDRVYDNGRTIVYSTKR